METLYYIIALFIVLFFIFYGDLVRKWFEKTEIKTDHELIKQYLLNDSPMYGNNKPKLWVHSKYEINARKWKSFQSRNTTDLNQPYLHLTVQSIVNMCGNDFHVCLIDDHSFSKLIPSWDVDLRAMSDPIRTHYRQIGMLKLIYYYGGLVVPDSFLCMRSLLPLFQKTLDKPVVAERLNRSKNILHENKQVKEFIADTYFMGARKYDPVIIEFLDFLKDQNWLKHFSSEHDFIGNTSWWVDNAVHTGRMTLLDGEVIGIKTRKSKPIMAEDLLGENYLDIEPNIFGIYIPSDEILKRTNMQWFSVMSRDEIMQSRLIIAKYLATSLAKSAGLIPSSNRVLPKSLDSSERVVIL
jgi:hypothetical protein